MRYDRRTTRWRSSKPRWQIRRADGETAKFRALFPQHLPTPSPAKERRRRSQPRQKQIVTRIAQQRRAVARATVPYLQQTPVYSAQVRAQDHQQRSRGIQRTPISGAWLWHSGSCLHRKSSKVTQRTRAGPPPWRTISSAGFKCAYAREANTKSRVSIPSTLKPPLRAASDNAARFASSCALADTDTKEEP
jgi:hypothetical protein